MIKWYMGFIAIFVFTKGIHEGGKANLDLHAIGGFILFGITVILFKIDSKNKTQ